MLKIDARRRCAALFERLRLRDAYNNTTTLNNNFTSVIMLVTSFLEASLRGVGVAKDGRLCWRYAFLFMGSIL